VALRVARDADLIERVANLGHVAQEGQPVEVGAGLLLVAADHERPLDPGVPEPRDEVAQVLAVTDHPRRDVRHGTEPGALELVTQRDGRIESLGG
jgi:hypothetical protein